MASSSSIQHRIAITGATGFIGTDLCAVLDLHFPGAAVLALGRRRLDLAPGITSVAIDMLTEEGRLLEEIERFQPTVIVQLAALTLYAPPPEKHGEYKKINTDIPIKIATLAKRIGALNVYTSTDLVFDGTRPPYGPDSDTNPLTIYGQSKRDAEVALLGDGNSLVVRYSQLIGLHGTFFATIYASLLDKKPLELFDDEFRSILQVEDAVSLLIGLIKAALKKDLDITVPWHLGGPQSVSRYEIGEALVKAIGADPMLIVPCKVAAISKVPRPRDTTMDSSASYAKADFIPRGGAAAVIAAVNSTRHALKR